MLLHYTADWTQNADQLLTHLSAELEPLIPHIKPYLLTSFGSFLRMDYGTGHETSFALFLLCLMLVRFFRPEADEERELVLRVFLRYLRLCWRLQDVYRLEPAGSHGVWGLDDSHFLSYIFGSGQLRGTILPLSRWSAPLSDFSHARKTKLKYLSRRSYIRLYLLPTCTSCRS
jgi:serine/threonine-protein phosphatase 2A activator